MKKTITILCIFALSLSLFGCAKIRDLNCYSVGEYNGGWSILYTDEDGVEEIVTLGSYAQPLALEKGRFYFIQDGKMVSVDPEGEERQEVAIANMDAGAIITFVDEENFYCLADRSGSRCWRVSKADANDHEEMDIPRQFRSTDYAALLAQLRQTANVPENRIRLRSAQAVLDGNGSLLTLELEILGYERFDGFGMNTWKNAGLRSRITLDGPQTTYINENVILSLADSTVEQFLPLEDFLTALETLDAAQVPASRAQGTAESFRVTYQVEEYEAAVTAELPRVNPDGQTVDTNSDAYHLVLSQAGGCDTVVTDNDGTESGNLTVVQLG